VRKKTLAAPSPSPEPATRIEYRSPDPAFAAMLGEGLAGVEGEYELPLEANNNIFEMTERSGGDGHPAASR
jgi:glutamine synthetase